MIRGFAQASLLMVSSPHRLTPSEFAAKWLGNTRTERAAAQEHFIDLCRMLEVATPNEADPTGEWYAFEKGAEKTGAGGGFADVWKRAHFGWEYKGKHKDLGAAYDQLLLYREALESPPLLVVCDLERFEIHTNFTNTKKVVHSFTLTDLSENPGEPLRILRAVMSNAFALKPEETPAQITEQAAARFARLAASLQARGHDPERVAHFLNRVLFCFFAQDSGLLPRGLVTRLVANTTSQPDQFTTGLKSLFGLMSTKGGLYGTERIDWFNGGLFDGDDVLDFTIDDLKVVKDVSALDWSQVEPAILGTLFERGLDPDKRGQLGAHYTDRGSIMRVVEPVVLAPLRREFEAMKVGVEELLASGKANRRSRRMALNPELQFRAFLDRLRTIRVLDPACGSGNFLYVTLQLLKDLEKEAILWGWERLKIAQPFPAVDPHVVLGIEVNPYAAELARVSIWIGHIQWMLNNGFSYQRDPVLEPLENIECRDAILVRGANQLARPAEWPDAEFVVGNPPFLGGKLLRVGLGDGYVDDLFTAWRGRVPREADLVCYWHEMAREMIAGRKTRRAGLLATNSIRGGANRRVLERLKQTGDIFMGWSDEPWVVEGAAVRVSIVAQDDGSETERTLDGRAVAVIHADLTGGAVGSLNLTGSRTLAENAKVAFMGDTKGGAFDLPGQLAREMLLAPINVNGRPNSDVVVPWANGLDITRRPRDMFIIDFGLVMTLDEAALYEAPFQYVQEHVMAQREKSRTTIKEWWLHERPRVEMRRATTSLNRFIITPIVAKHRLFTWASRPTLPDHQLIVIARDDDYAFGVLHARAHELWALRMGTWQGKGNDPRYTPTSTFETFPFPWPLNTPEDAMTAEQRRNRDAVANAAQALDEARERWFNPAGLARREPDVVSSLPSRLVPVDEAATKELIKRTLTNLYNQRPQWLDNLHRTLDAAVLAAYGWSADMSETELLGQLLALNHQRTEAQTN